MERLTERYGIAPDGESDVWVKQHDYISAARKLCDYEDLEERLHKIFGEELYFEINTLFSNEDLCFNLRNRLSHGLINYETFYSYPYIYSWLLIFNIVFFNFLHNTKNN